jgi:ribosomal-protein-alanine N-acetyltransferase
MLQLNFSYFPELKTERLLLRRISEDDAPDIFVLRSDEDVLRYVGKEPAKTIEDAEKFIRTVDEGLHSTNAVMWGIALKNDLARLIGTICLWNIQKENYRAEIGYVLHPEFWRKGIMKEAIQQVIEYGFKKMGLHSIEARIHADNKASAAILEATGFLKEGLLKEEFCFRGKFSDTVIYSQLQ